MHKRTEWALEAAKKMSDKRGDFTIIVIVAFMIICLISYALTIIRGATICLN